MAALPDSAIHPLDPLLPGVVAAWVEAACRVADSSDEGPPGRVVYVDAFAGAEWLFGIGQPGRGAPSRAVAAACAAAERGATVALVEEDPALLARLEGELRALGWGARSAFATDLTAAEPGQVVLLAADFHNVADVLTAVDAGTRLLVWMACPAARRLPWRVLGGILADPAAEVLVRFPAEDFEKLTGAAGPLADLPPFTRRLLEGCSALLGDARHAWLGEWRERCARRDAGAMETVLGRFCSSLSAAAGERRVKRVDLPGTLLLMATAHASAALALNDGAAAAREAIPAPAGDPRLDLFEMPAARPLPAADPAAALGEGFVRRYGGLSVRLAEIEEDAAATEATSGDLRRALALLRRAGRVIYRSLRHPDALLVFPERPLRPARRPRAGRQVARCADLFDAGGG